MTYKGSQVLITGANGVIGRALTEELASAGYGSVRGVGSRDADLTDTAAAVELFEQVQPDLVFHLAARVYGIMGNQANRAAAFLDNTRINTNVIDAAQRSGVRKIVAMGSVAIYADGIPAPMRETDIWNGPPHGSEAPYAHSKRAMYAQLEAFREQYGLDYAYCVSTNLYGPYDRFDENWGHVIPSLISKFHRAATRSEGVTVWGSGNVRRDFLFSRDAARAMRMIAENVSGAINLATGTTHSIRETAELIKKVSDYRGEIEWDPRMPDGQRERDYSVSRLADLGFTPDYDVERGFDATYRWFAENCVSVRR